MLEVLSESRFERVYHYDLHFATSVSGGFSFPCDENGNVLELNPAAEANYQKCISGGITTIKPAHVVSFVQVTRIPKVCKCTCGHSIRMDIDSEGLVYCDCGATYNGAGQSIRPRSEWEERYEDDY